MIILPLLLQAIGVVAVPDRTADAATSAVLANGEAEEQKPTELGPRWQSVVARVKAQEAYLTCAEERLDHFIQEKEPAATLAQAAIDLCGPQREAFVARTRELMESNSDADAWISQTEADILRRLTATVILFRSDYPTGSAP